MLHLKKMFLIFVKFTKTKNELNLNDVYLTQKLLPAHCQVNTSSNESECLVNI
jgi:hypothetical protein